MMRKTSLAAALLLVMTPAIARATPVTGIPVYDEYSGDQCFKFWVYGSTDYYAIHIEPKHQTMIDLIRDAARDKKMVTLNFWDDVLPPLQDTYAPKTWCLSGDGMSLKFYPQPVNVGINK